MSEVKFKTMRHIEAVRNLLLVCIENLHTRMITHDQSKLEFPEEEIFEKYTANLKELTYGSDGYFKTLEKMKPALDHHYSINRHHPEFHENGIKDMTLTDLMEMLCDWYAASQRHADGNIFDSIEMNQKRFGYSDELKRILISSANEMLLSGPTILYKIKES